MNDTLKNELVTRELFEERSKTIDERFKRQDFKLNVLIGLVFVGLAFANPAFADLIKHVFK